MGRHYIISAENGYVRVGVSWNCAMQFQVTGEGTATEFTNIGTAVNYAKAAAKANPGWTVGVQLSGNGCFC